MGKKTTVIGQMQNAIQRVIGVVAQVAQAAAQDVAALEAGKADKVSGVLVTIPATGWESDGTAGYPRYYDIKAAGVTAMDRASVDLSPTSQGTAAACGLCPACETLEGKIRLRAANAPAVAMTANFWIEKGV